MLEQMANPLNADQHKDQAALDRALQARLRVIGLCILAAGLLAATFVAGRTSSGDVISGPDTKRDVYQMEVLGGKSNILATEIREWVGSLWHGKRLAYTLATVSITSSLVCFFLAQSLNHSPALKGRDSERG
jgi:hypothetical protein